MNRIIFILTLSAFLFSQQAEVTNIQAAQRTDGSQIVDITYDITPDAVFTYFNVSGQVSMDGGGTYEDMQFTTGDIGTGITAGTGRAIMWGFGQQFNETYSNQVKIKINATSTAIIAGDSLEVPFEMITIPAGDFTLGGDECVDMTNLDGSPWHSWGQGYPIPEYDCRFWQVDMNCDDYGDVYNNDAGYSAQDACCGCGGGIFYDGDEEVIQTVHYDYDIMKFDVTDFDYVVYIMDELNNGSYDNCTDLTNLDGSPWYDLGGIEDIYQDFGCDWYVQAECPDFGDSYNNDAGYNAQEACCDCGGGDSMPAGDNIGVYPDGIYGNYPGDALYPAGEYLFLDFSQSKISHNGDIFEVEEGFANHPVTGVTWFGAWHFATHYGLQLPSQFEWVKAARGMTGYYYPWGDEISIYNANYGLNYQQFSFPSTTPVGFFNGQTYSYEPGSFSTREVTLIFELDVFGMGDNWFTLLFWDIGLYTGIFMGQLEQIGCSNNFGCVTVTYNLMPGDYSIILGDIYGDGHITVNISYTDSGESINSFTLYANENNMQESFVFTVDPIEGSRDDITLIDSPSPYGLYDMAGNVSQWLNKAPDENIVIVKGGSWASESLSLISWNNEEKNPTESSQIVGFRCIKQDNSGRNISKMLELHIRSHRPTRP